MAKELCIGTAQIGLEYGITNVEGRPTSEMAIDILKLAMLLGVSYLDTAEGYGCAHSLIKQASGYGVKMNIITKVRFSNKKHDFCSLEEYWDERLKQIINELGVECVYALLVHDIWELNDEERGRLISWLQHQKAKKLVGAWGCSIYEEVDLAENLLGVMDIVQIPLSIYDQRMIESGFIANLKHRGVKVFVRSIYLQGLIASYVDAWPDWINDDLKQHHLQFCAEAESRLVNPGILAQSFIKQLDEVDGVVFGVSNLKELQEFVENWENVQLEMEYEKWSISDNMFLDPRKWPKASNQ